jgi:hypothetical protein
MDDEERIRKIVIEEVEKLVKKNCWPDEVVREALIEIARNHQTLAAVAKGHLWMQEFWVRVKILGAAAAIITAVGSMIFTLLSLLGVEIVHK